MTTNQTIEGVPRELLERVREKLSQTDYTWSVGDPEEELRAVLDKPAAPVPPCAIADALESAQWPNTSIGNKVLVAAAITELRKAARPQGEPVCEVIAAERGARTLLWLADQLPNIGTKLYAEQPAPVAVVMPERKDVKAGLLSESNTHNQGWNACLDEVTRLNDPRTPFEILHDAEPGDEAAFREWREERRNGIKT